jgi:hypothetical protein
MLVAHFIGILLEFVKTVEAHLFVTDINTGMEAGKVNVYPVGVFRLVLKKTGIPDDVGIDRVLKGIGIARLAEFPVLVGGKGYFKIPFGFRGIRAVTGHP